MKFNGLRRAKRGMQHAAEEREGGMVGARVADGESDG